MDSNEIKVALEGLQNDPAVPTWAKVLVNIFQDLVVKRQEADMLNIEKIVEIEITTKAVKDEMDQLRTENRIMKIKMAALQDELDAAEQYSRRNCLIFHGLPEEQGELTSDKIMNIVHNQLKIPNDADTGVIKRDIDRSHRLGKFNKLASGRQTRSAANQAPRPIIVKFKGYDTRSAVFNVKRELKGTNIMITENLTKTRYALLKKCIEKLGKGKVWSYDGRITSKLSNNTYTVIDSESDLLKL